MGKHAHVKAHFVARYSLAALPAVLDIVLRAPKFLQPLVGVFQLLDDISKGDHAPVGEIAVQRVIGGKHGGVMPPQERAQPEFRLAHGNAQALASRLRVATQPSLLESATYSEEKSVLRDAVKAALHMKHAMYDSV